MSFKGIPGLRSADEIVELTLEQILEWERCKKDLIYFIRKYVYFPHIDSGSQLFNPYEFQVGLLNLFQSERFVLARTPRQVGKNSCVLSFILWYLVFHSDKTVAMTSVKLDMAKGLLARLKDSYWGLPEWMQPGIRSWSNRGISIGNGSTVFISGGSCTGVASRAIDLLYIDEFAYFPLQYALDFLNSVMPTVMSSSESKIIIPSTPNGFKDNVFCDMWFDPNSPFAKVRVPWDAVPGRDDAWAAAQIRLLGQVRFDQEFKAEFISA